jgi:C1A family cysteine protease
MAKTKREKRIRNCDNSRNKENDWTYDHAIAARSLAKTASLPTSKDLRESWWRIADQEQTGSCVGWASADGVLRWHFVKAGKLKRNQLLSVRFQWMASKETDTFVNYATTFIEDAGTSLKAALDIARKYGCIEETILPFKGTLSPLEEEVFYAKAAARKISSYYSLSGGNKINNFKAWLANKGPILARLECDRTWDTIGRNGKLDDYDANSANGGHAVVLVGYTKDHFIVRNSWGTKWGDKGFAYASYAYTQAAFSEGYGVVV